jgi:hypothetical protein
MFNAEISVILMLSVLLLSKSKGFPPFNFLRAQPAPQHFTFAHLAIEYYVSLCFVHHTPNTHCLLLYLS